MWGNTAAIHSVLKKKNYKAKFSTSSILKKIKSTDTIFKKIIIKKTQKNRDKKTLLETLQQFTMFCDESYSASSHDLALFVMTYNCNFQPAQY